MRTLGWAPWQYRGHKARSVVCICGDELVCVENINNGWNWEGGTGLSVRVLKKRSSARARNPFLGRGEFSCVSEVV